MSKPDLEIQDLTSTTVFQTDDFLENIFIESHKVWRDNKSIKGILVRLLVDYINLVWPPPSLHLLSKHATPLPQSVRSGSVQRAARPGEAILHAVPAPWSGLWWGCPTVTPQLIRLKIHICIFKP